MKKQTLKLAEVAEINPRRSSLDISDEDYVSFVPMEAVDDVTGTLLNPQKRQFKAVKKGYTYFQEDDVLFAKITPCMQNGKHAIATGLIQGLGFGSTEFHVIRPGKRITSEWIHYFCRHKKTIEAAIRTFTGTVGQQRVPPTFIENLEIPLPSVEEQRKITSCLKAQFAAIEEARNAAQLQVKELKTLSTRALNALFDNICDKRPIGDAAKVQSGFAFKSQDFHTSGVRLLRNANVSPGRIDWADVVFLPENKCSKIDGYVMQEGDVIISLDRPIISSGIKVARVTAADLPSLLVQRVGRFLLDKTLLDADYLFAFLQTNHFINAISGHEQSLGVPHISPGQVEAVEIPMPPIEEQRRISAVAKEILDTTAEAHRAAVAMLANISVLPSRLLAQAFDV